MKFTASELYSGSTRLIEASFEGKSTVYTVGRLVPAEDIYKFSERGSAPGKYSLALWAYKAYIDGDMALFSNEGRDAFYVEMYDKKAMILKTADKSYSVYASPDCESLHLCGLLGAVAGLTLDLFHDVIKTPDGKSKALSPGYFCDATYFGFFKNSSIIVNEESEEKIAELFTDAELKDVFEKESETEESTYPEPEISVGKEDISWEDVLAGKYDFPTMAKEKGYDFDWPEEVIAAIPPREALQNFVPTKTFWKVFKKIIFRFTRILDNLMSGMPAKQAMLHNELNLSFTGVPGVGKSYTLKMLCAALGIPLWIVPMHKDIGPEHIEGGPKLIDKDLKYIPSEVANGMIYGGIVDSEEGNTPPADALMQWMKALDEEGVILENGYKKTYRSPFTIFAVTYNRGTYGTKNMNQAFMNRYNNPYKVEAPTKDDLIELLVKAYPETRVGKCNAKRVATWVINAYERVMNTLDGIGASDIALVESLRSCYGAMASIEEGEDPFEAVERCFAIHAGDYDPDTETELEKVLKAMPRM